MSWISRIAAALSAVMLVVALFLALARLLRGPSLADRVVALDLMAVIAVGLISSSILATGETAYLEVAAAVALLSFLGTVAYAHYIERRGAS